MIGAIGIFFDWKNQADSVLKGVRLSEDERSRSRLMLIDDSHRIIASSDTQNHLGERIELQVKAGHSGGYSILSKNLIQGYSVTPGFETYPGMGWLGVIEQHLPTIEA